MKYRLLILPIIFLALPGCVGVWVLSEGSWVDPYPAVKLESHKIAKNRKPYELPTKQSILCEYGQPDEVEKSGGKEIWRYDDEIGWSGVVLVLVVPLPFILPSTRQTIYEFEVNKPLLTKKIKTYTTINGCGILAVLYTWIGCDSI